MLFDFKRVPTSYEHEPLDPSRHRLADCEVDQREIDDGQPFLWNHLCRKRSSRAEARDVENGSNDGRVFHRVSIGCRIVIKSLRNFLEVSIL